MAWESKFINYGVIKIDPEFNVVRVYYTSNNYENIHVSGVLSATWAGDCVLIKLQNGKAMKYKNTANYDWV